MFGIVCDPLQHTSMYQRLNEDSDDSDGEGGLGNVSRVIIRPPGHSGKAKRGHLCFDAAFETGNLGRADLVGEFEYDLFLRPDTCNPRYRFWFNFTVDNVKQDQRVIFNIINISNPRNLLSTGLTPLVKSTARPKWQRLPKHHVFYYRSAVHQNHYVLSFAFAFDKEDEVYQFAIAPPYSYSRLQAYLNVLETRFMEKRFVKSCLGKSLQNRKLDLITIDHVPKPDKVDSKTFIRVIIILARAHPGESPSSYVCQGLLEFLLGNHPIASILRSNFIFKIVPMVNPDGVFLGNNRCNLVGQDLNRTWHLATELSHPTLFAIKNMMREIDNSDVCCYAFLVTSPLDTFRIELPDVLFQYYQIDFVFDIHAHSSLLGSFIYGSTYDDVYRYERHLVFPRLFAMNTHDYVASNVMFNADDRKIGTARRYCCDRLTDSANAYTIQVSMGGYYLKDGKTLTPYTEDGYMRLGRNIARTLLQYYRFTNILPIPSVPEMYSKRNRPKTHHARSRSKVRYEIKPRPKTTRPYAPISYTDLSIYYDSGTSDEGSPVRPAVSHSGYQFGKRSAGVAHSVHDQFSLLSVKSSKIDQIELKSDLVSKTRRKLPILQERQLYRNVETLNVPPRPYLSIIDFNQLTRGSLEKATAKCKERISRPTDRVRR